MNQATSQWIQSNWDNFHQSLEEGAYELAQAVADDAYERGYRSDAARMKKELEAAINQEKLEDIKLDGIWKLHLESVPALSMNM